jgi:hypothetical protein
MDRSLADWRATTHTHTRYGALAQEHGKVVYVECIFVGYRDRWYQSSHLDVSFNHSDLAASVISTTGEFTVAVAVANAGSLPG